MIKILIKEAEAGSRIDYLLALKTVFSRHQIQKLIKEKLVTINNFIPKAHYLVKSNDEIIITPPVLQDAKISPQNLPLNIVYEDRDIIVLDKANKIIVHPAPGHWNDTLVNGLLFHCAHLSGIGGVKRPGVVHRIDKETTGLLVFAKNDGAHNHLAAQFQKRTIIRSYLALV